MLNLMQKLIKYHQFMKSINLQNILQKIGLYREECFNEKIILEGLIVSFVGMIFGGYEAYKNRNKIKKILLNFKIKSEYPESTSISRYNLDK